MFSFLNRNKAQIIDAKKNVNGQPEIIVNLDDAKKNLYDSVVLRRTDIVVSLMNEWFKVHKNSEESLKFFFNSNFCENGTTNPLLIAYRLKDKDLLRTLLNFGADPSLADTKTRKCLTELINEEKGDNLTTSQMKQLLSDCFMQSIVQVNIQSIRQYLRSGLELNNIDESRLPDGNTYLHWAVMYANEPVVRLLLENGANVNVTNKHGAIPLQECIVRKCDSSLKSDTLQIIETLLVYKSDPYIRGTSGAFKDLNSIELALMRQQTDPDIYALLKDFVNDVISTTSSSLPNSPLKKSIDSINDSVSSRKFSMSSNISMTNILDTIIDSKSQSHLPSFVNGTKSKTESEQLQNWSSFSTENSNKSVSELASLLWPKPQNLVIISENDQDGFSLANIKTQPVFIYFKPPYTYLYLDLVNKLASSFSGLTFYCIHKPVETPFVSVTIDKTMFQQESAYSILVKRSKIEINAVDSIALQYAFFTFMQLCKIYARKSFIPSLRIIDYSDVKCRAVLMDFSQGYYFKYDSLLSVLQMYAFYKINQVHFYVKFSSLPPASTKRQWYHYIDNWFGLMKFCEEVNLQIVPSIDITNDVAELCDVYIQIKEYLDLFKGFKYINIGPRLSSMLTCMENKNPFALDSNQYMMLCSYLYHNGDEETFSELDKFDKYVLMEYGLKAGSDFGVKSSNLYKSGQPFYYCIGSCNWNSMLGCPDGSLNNLYDAIKRQSIDQPLGILLCNFIGSLYRNPFAFNLNSIIMFAGATWNSKISMDELKRNLPDIMITHGLISDRDGHLGIVLLELGNMETYLTRKAVNSKDFLDLPYDNGSIFTRLLYKPDEIDLDYLDKSVFKKTFFHLRAQQSKLKSLLNESTNSLFREVQISAEIVFHLFKFLITLYNTGTKQQLSSNKVSGLNVINIGVSNLTQTIRTDLANKILLLKGEYKNVLDEIYHQESVDEYFNDYYVKLIEKLLIDQDESNLADLDSHIKNVRNLDQKEKKLRSISTSSSFQSHYYMQANEDNQLLFKK